MGSSGQVLHGSLQGIQVLRFLGQVKYALGPIVQRFVGDLFSGPPPLGFIIDLSETQSIDSTILGLLANIANRMRERGGPRVTIISTQDDINEILLNMGFDEIFDIVGDGPLDPENARPLPMDKPEKRALEQVMLDAHRTLMALNERNRVQFTDVVNLLEKQCAGDHSRPA